MSDKLYDEGWGFASNMDEEYEEIEEGIKEVSEMSARKAAGSRLRYAYGCRRA